MGTKSPNVITLEKICDALGLTFAEFFATDSGLSTVAAHRSDGEYGELPIKRRSAAVRLPNGFGTCYKLPGNRRKPYIARAFKGIADNGKCIYETIGYFDTRREGMDALVMHQHNPVTPKANLTLEQLYTEWSLGAYKNITRETADNYRAAWKHLSRFARVKVKEVRTGHFQQVIDERHKAGMSRSTLEKIRTTSVLLFSYAMENDIVNKNYAKFVRLPRKEKTKTDRFTDLEIKKLFAHATDEWVSTILILIYTGMRISEMLNLTRFSVNLDAGVLVGGLKTDAGKDRAIPIHPKIIKHVKSWYDKQGDRLICLDGKRILPDRYRTEFYYPALEVAGVRKLVPHTCRHTFCTILAEMGADTQSIQKLAGHTDYGFTANQYTHPEVETLRKAINKM